MVKIKFDSSNAEKFVSKEEIKALSPFVEAAHDMLHRKTGRGE